MSHSHPWLTSSPTDYCDAYDSTAKYTTLQLTSCFEIFIYFLCFLLGCRNVCVLLIGEGFYKATFVSLLYFVGQTICLLRISAGICFTFSVRMLHKNGYCDLTKKEITSICLDQRKRKLFVGDSRGHIQSINIKNGARMKKFKKEGPKSKNKDKEDISSLYYWGD